MLVNQTLLYSVSNNTNRFGLSFAKTVLMLFEKKWLKKAHSPYSSEAWGNLKYLQKKRCPFFLPKYELRIL